MRQAGITDVTSAMQTPSVGEPWERVLVDITGPHLGHLVQRRTPSGSETWFIDDACEVGTCDVLRNRRLDYFKLGSAGFQKVTTLELPAGVQQKVKRAPPFGSARFHKSMLLGVLLQLPRRDSNPRPGD